VSTSQLQSAAPEIEASRRESASSPPIEQPPCEQYAGLPAHAFGNGASRLLSSPALSHSANRGLRAVSLKRAQQTYGNRFAQSAVAGIQRNSARLAQRQCACSGGCDKCRAGEALNLSRSIQTQSAAPPGIAGRETGDRSVIPSTSAGVPLDERTRRSLEPRFGADFSGVRVHTDRQAAESAGALGARAYTMGRNIYFAGGEYAPSTAEGQHLLAHELTHTLQQPESTPSAEGLSLAELNVSQPDDPLEVEAEAAATTVQLGQSVTVQGRSTAPSAQRGLIEWAENKAWSLLEEYAPELVPIIRRGPEGVFEWIKEQISSAFEAMFNTLMAPVRAVSGVGKWLQAHFGPLLTWMQEAAAKIARNDCSPIREAAEKIEKVAESIITPIVEKLQSIAKTVGDFFSDLWARFGAPVWEWIKKYAGQQWDQIQRLATWIWDKTAPIRNILARAWTWLKNKLGIGEGPEGQNGILQWVQRKAEAAWDWVKARIEPYKQQLLTVAAVLGGIALLMSPAGPVLIVGGIIVGVVQGVRWIKANWSGDMIVRAREYLHDTLIPSVLGAVNRVTGALTRMAAAINGKLGELAAGMGRMVSTVAGSILRFAVAAVQWIADQITELVRWGTEKLHALVEWVQTGLARLQTFLQPVFEFLGKVAHVVADIYGLPFMLAGKVWNMIPSCIRDPFVDFIIPIILRQIAIFRELVKDNEAWQKTKAEVMEIVRLVFHDHDLIGALKKVFHLILRVFNVPVELAIEVAKKAAAAWDAVLEQPMAFIKNTVRAIGHGFKLFWNNLLSHLEYGIEGWLFGELADKGIHAPASWTNPMDVLGFVLDVLGLNMNHIFDLLAKKFPDKVERLRVWYGRLASAWDWVRQVIDTSKSPGEITAGLITQAKEFGKSVLESVVTWVATAVTVELAEIAAAAAASGGLSEVLDIARRIYRAIESAVRWMRKILEMVNTVLDSILQIVHGAIEPAGAKLEAAMHKAMPVVIGFLADQVGLGGIGEQMRGFVDKLREKVDNAILWVIDKVKALIDALIQGASSVVGAIRDWWSRKVSVGEGENKHTLYFEGGEENAELYLRSSPRRLDEWITDLKANPDYGSPAKQKALNDAQGLIPVIRADIAKARAARKAGKDAEAEEHGLKVQENFDKAGSLLGIVFEGDAYGTEADPIPLPWPGPDTSAYRTLYFGGRIGRTKPQSELYALFTKKQKDETNTEVNEYKPHDRKALPGGAAIGLTSDYHVHDGVKVGPLSTDSTGGGDKLGNLIIPYGFSGSGEDMDLDHVREIQFGGLDKNDRVENLWPLDASTNRAKGSRLSRAPVDYPKAHPTTIAELKRVQNKEVKEKKKFWFRITR
jgi:phage-related protein